MAVDANASDIIKKLDEQLTACSSWTGTNYYPSVDLSAVAVYPIAVLDSLDETGQQVAESGNVTGGELGISIWSDTLTIAELETLGRDIKAELLEQDRQIPFISISVGLASEAPRAREASDTAVQGIDISINYGLGG